MELCFLFLHQIKGNPTPACQTARTFGYISSSKNGGKSKRKGRPICRGELRFAYFFPWVEKENE